ncbi:MAG: hypothetical protein J7621_26460 [Niastella sp.]|nr:hypothetical protein [Niastella sp.]
MKQTSKKYQVFWLRKTIPAVAMMLLLLLLTSMNFFVYASSDSKAKTNWTASNEEESPETNNPCSPTGPDEKAPNKPVSVNEEYIHEGPEMDHPSGIESILAHKIHAAEKLQIVHFELVTPPPKA